MAIAKKEILYPIFLECCQFAEDTFWENIFEDLVYGKTPYGTYINKNFLCCSYKNKEFSYKIERKDPKILYDDIYSLLTNKLGILSQREKNKKRIDFYRTENEIKENTQDWANIRKKNIRDTLVELYVIDMKQKYKLTNLQAKNLLSSIFIGLIFKVINSKDITYEDGKITKIEGIEFRKGGYTLIKNIYNVEYDFTLEQDTEKKVMSENWKKYLTSLKKK
jgi:hypothetical protein